MAVLVAAVPPFLAMPLWGDVTLYDVAAREVRTGGLHYRDVFDTNPPGFVWCLVGVRAAAGPSSEVLRAVDLSVVAAACGMVSLILRRVGAGGVRVLGFLLAVALFYPFQSEFCHAQRDVWMLLPAAAATWLRSHRAGFWAGVLQGILWGVAVWFKPHVVVPALAVWLATLPTGWRAKWFDLAGHLAGGLAVGGAGVAYLVASGTWPYFWEVMTVWNPEYAGGVLVELDSRLPWKTNYFGVWDLLHVVALPLAAVGLFAGGRPRRALAALYLGWYAQALLLQRTFPYVHVPEVILALAVAAGRGVPVGLLAVAWFALRAALAFVPRFEAFADRHEVPGPHALTTTGHYEAWPRCLRDGSSFERRDELGWLNTVHCGTTWTDLSRVADFLRTADLRDRELVCWHDGTHPLYLMLNVRPGFRYMHVDTAWAFASKRERIAGELRAAGGRFVVADLKLLTTRRTRENEPGEGGRWDRLPAWVQPSQRGLFPWNQRIVFRSGRYVVFEMAPPLGPLDLPGYEELEAEEK